MSVYPTYDEWETAFLFPVAAMLETIAAMDEFLAVWGPVSDGGSET